MGENIDVVSNTPEVVKVLLVEPPTSEDITPQTSAQDEQMDVLPQHTIENIIRPPLPPQTSVSSTTRKVASITSTPTLVGPPPIATTGGHTPNIPPPIQSTTAETMLINFPRGPPLNHRPLGLRGPPPFGPRGMPRGPVPRIPLNHPELLMVPPVPPGIPSDLWEWFFHSDEDKDGRITGSEVQRLLLKGKWSPFKEETCKMMLEMMDDEKIGTLDAYQMTSLWNSLVDWKNIFDDLDTEKRGRLNASQMFKALEKFGYRLSSEFCDAVVERFAVDHDEKGGEQVLYFDDFIKTRVMLKLLTESFQIFDSNKVGVIDLHYEQFLEMVLNNAM